MWILRVLTACVFTHGCIVFAAPAQATVKTAQGEAAGKWILDGTQKAFLGLPYAAPPTGELRWKPPQGPATWKGVRDATNFGARCVPFDPGARSRISADLLIGQDGMARAVRFVP
jgi:para-nitrobenzyl esterase